MTLSTNEAMLLFAIIQLRELNLAAKATDIHEIIHENTGRDIQYSSLVNPVLAALVRRAFVIRDEDTRAYTITAEGVRALEEKGHLAWSCFPKQRLP